MGQPVNTRSIGDQLIDVMLDHFDPFHLGSRLKNWLALLETADIDDAEAAMIAVGERMAEMQVEINRIAQIPKDVRTFKEQSTFIFLQRVRAVLRVDRDALQHWLVDQRRLDYEAGQSQLAEQEAQIQAEKTERQKIAAELEREQLALEQAALETQRRAIEASFVVQKTQWETAKREIVRNRLARFTGRTITSDGEPMAVVSELYRILSQLLGREQTSGRDLLTPEEQLIKDTIRDWLNVEAARETNAHIMNVLPDVASRTNGRGRLQQAS